MNCWQENGIHRTHPTAREDCHLGLWNKVNKALRNRITIKDIQEGSEQLSWHYHSWKKRNNPKIISSQEQGFQVPETSLEVQSKICKLWGNKKRIEGPLPNIKWWVHKKSQNTHFNIAIKQLHHLSWPERLQQQKHGYSEIFLSNAYYSVRIIFCIFFQDANKLNTLNFPY